MTEYRVMARAKHQKRHQCYGHHTDSFHADRHAECLAKRAWTASVKVIVDDGYTKEELIYKNPAE